MTLLDELDEDVTHWAEDDNPESLAGEDLGNGDSDLKMAGVLPLAAEVTHG